MLATTGPKVSVSSGINEWEIREFEMRDYDGPGNGSTHVPFGHSVAGIVKSPTLSSPLANYKETDQQIDAGRCLKALTASRKKCGMPVCSAARLKLSEGPMYRSTSSTRRENPFHPSLASGRTSQWMV